MRIAKALFRLGLADAQTDLSSLGAQAILLGLSWGGSNASQIIQENKRKWTEDLTHMNALAQLKLWMSSENGILKQQS